LQTPVPSFVELVARREPAKLAKLPGVGKKTAERILVDLADKIAALGAPAGGPAPTSPEPPATAPSGPPVLGDLVSALVNLGFKEAVAAESARAAVENLGADAPLDALLRDALARNRPRA
jgi:Holliday junction DNA helicase RuvA